MTETALHLINKYWPETVKPVPAGKKDQDLFDAVRLRLKFLLDNDMERLLHTLYRVDVAERRVREVLATSPPDQIDTALTELVLERVEEKMETRRKYGSAQ